MRDNSPFQPREKRNREIDGQTSCPGHTARLRTSGQTHRGREGQREAPRQAGQAGDPCSKPPSVLSTPGHWTGSRMPGAAASRLSRQQGVGHVQSIPPTPIPPRPHPPVCLPTYLGQGKTTQIQKTSLTRRAIWHGNPGRRDPGGHTRSPGRPCSHRRGGRAKGISTDKAHRWGHAGKYFREIFYSECTPET